MADIAQSLKAVQQRIADAAQAAMREADDIQLVAVSKTKPTAMVEAAYQAGQTRFGENYVQEAIEKITALKHLPLEWHYIGKLQSNKCKAISSHFAWVHGITALKHARLLSEYRQPHQHPIQACIQINLTEESSKNGVATDQIADITHTVDQLPHIQLRGLMTLSNPNTDSQKKLLIFQQLADLRDQLNQQGLKLDTLSMGMSADLELAIAAGSNLVRIGTDIFGARR